PDSEEKLGSPSGSKASSKSENPETASGLVSGSISLSDSGDTEIASGLVTSLQSVSVTLDAWPRTGNMMHYRELKILEVKKTYDSKSRKEAPDRSFDTSISPLLCEPLSGNPSRHVGAMVTARAIPAVQATFQPLSVKSYIPGHGRSKEKTHPRAEPMQHVIPHEPPTEEDLRSQTPTSTTNSRQLELKDKRTTRKPKSLSNKQKLKIQRGVEISDKLLNKSSKKHARKENRDAAKKIYE
ncbi:hypothetical protein PSTT_12484, partial [Puccinia striiformis]